MTSAISYIRVSGASQVDGDGPERQAHATVNYAARNKLRLAIDPVRHIVGETLTDYPFFDAGVSGTKDYSQRPGLLAAFEYCAEHGVDTILVEKSDRLSRDLMVGFSILAECRRLNIRVIDCSTGAVLTETDDPYAKFILQVLLAAAELNKNIFVDQSRKARQRIRERTGKCEGAKGYRELHRETFDLISHHVAQGHGAQQIADILNLQGIPTLKGKPWKRGTVHPWVRKIKEGAA